MLLFFIAFWVGQTLLNLLAIVQFLWLLFAKRAQSILGSVRQFVIDLVL